MSGSSCTQPEIFDVPETIITVQAQKGIELTGSPNSSNSENLDQVSRNLLIGDSKELISSHGSGNSLKERFSKVKRFVCNVYRYQNIPTTIVIAVNLP